MTEQNSIREENSHHKYRTEIPNIVYELKLDPYEMALYSYFKKVAGDSGDCTLSNAKIAEATSMSVSSVKEKRRSLATKQYEIFGNRTLITVEERFKANGEPDTTQIIITDIWPDNYQILSSRFSSNRGRSPESRPRSPGGHKEEPLKKSSSDSDSDAGAADNQNEEKIFYKKPNGEHHAIWKSEIELVLESYNCDIVSETISRLRKQKTISDPYKAASIIAENMLKDQKRKEAKNDNDSKRKNVRGRDSEERGVFANGVRDDGPISVRTMEQIRAILSPV